MQTSSIKSTLSNNLKVKHVRPMKNTQHKITSPVPTDTLPRFLLSDASLEKNNGEIPTCMLPCIDWLTAMMTKWIEQLEFCNNFVGTYVGQRAFKMFTKSDNLGQEVCHQLENDDCQR